LGKRSFELLTQNIGIPRTGLVRPEPLISSQVLSIECDAEFTEELVTPDSDAYLTRSGSEDSIGREGRVTAPMSPRWLTGNLVRRNVVRDPRGTCFEE
jgi:hypothetical protein